MDFGPSRVWIGWRIEKQRLDQRSSELTRLIRCTSARLMKIPNKTVGAVEAAIGGCSGEKREVHEAPFGRAIEPQSSSIRLRCPDCGLRTMKEQLPSEMPPFSKRFEEARWEKRARALRLGDWPSSSGCREARFEPWGCTTWGSWSGLPNAPSL